MGQVGRVFLIKENAVAKNAPPSKIGYGKACYDKRKMTEARFFDEHVYI